MDQLDSILSIDGVLAAGEFSTTGELIGFRAREGFELPAEAAAKVAASCARANQAMCGFGAEMSSHMDEAWDPPVGWMYAAGRYTVAIGNGFGVFVDTFSVDFNDLFNGIAGVR